MQLILLSGGSGKRLWPLSNEIRSKQFIKIFRKQWMCENKPHGFDVQELRRVFDNLASNVKKYADPKRSVELVIEKNEQDIQIKQKNAVNRALSTFENNKGGF
jgi:signal transduction histidine kinase